MYIYIYLYIQKLRYKGSYIETPKQRLPIPGWLTGGFHKFLRFPGNSLSLAQLSLEFSNQLTRNYKLILAQLITCLLGHSLHIALIWSLNPDSNPSQHPSSKPRVLHRSLDAGDPQESLRKSPRSPQGIVGNPQEVHGIPWAPGFTDPPRLLGSSSINAPHAEHRRSFDLGALATIIRIFPKRA